MHNGALAGICAYLFLLLTAYSTVRCWSTKRQLSCVELELTDALQKHIKELVRQSAQHVMHAGGVVRSIDSWGTRMLPQRMRRHRQAYNYGECVDLFSWQIVAR